MQFYNQYTYQYFLHSYKFRKCRFENVMILVNTLSEQALLMETTLFITLKNFLFGNQ